MARDPTVRNVALLGISQALFMTSQTLVIAVSALVGSALAPDKALATLPLGLQFLTMMLSTIPASLFMRRFGRRAGFSLGALLGLAGGLTGTWAIWTGNFALFCLASAFVGGSAAHAAYYRYAAADTASEAFKSRAISLVLAGGVVAAVLGPELAKWSRELFAPVLFAGGYLVIAALAFLTLVIVRFIEIPRPTIDAARGSGRPIGQIMSQPNFVVAALCAMVGYGAMNLVMVSTPLAMVDSAHPFDTAAFVIQWHVLGMFAPSFVTGHLIRRFGVLQVMASGAALILGSVAINLSGTESAQFLAALTFLGVGWNFLFVGGTTLLTDTYGPEEKAKTQGANDFLVFSMTACTAFSSGALYHAFGWQAVNLGVIVPVVLALGAVVWLGRRRALVPERP